MPSVVGVVEVRSDGVMACQRPVAVPDQLYNLCVWRGCATGQG